MRILAGVDGSQQSTDAVRFASRLLSAAADEMVLYCSPPHFQLKGSTEIGPEMLNEARAALATAVFRQTTETLPEAWRPRLRTVTGQNKPAEGILAAAEQQRVDLVAVGSHSATRKLKLFLGGVARSVVHHANLPVLVVRNPRQELAKPLQVMIACDETTRWSESMGILRQLSWPAETVATLTHVVEAMDEDQLRTVTAYGHSSTHDGSQLVRQYLEEIEERKADSQQRLDKDCQQLLSTFPQIKVESVAGHVVERIVQKATDDQVDLVVLAARKLNALQRFFGSTTEGLLVQCPCSLLIVHEQAPV